MSESQMLQQLLDEDVLIPTIAIVGGVVAVVVKIVASMVLGVSRERTRREIAAYIAEGSMSAEQGERLMKAKDKKDCA